MKETPLVLDRMAMHQLLIAASFFFVFMCFYTVYSTVKFGTLSTKSLVKSTVVMKVIQHNVKSVCPRCGAKGIPNCPQCNVRMHWNGYRGSFICSACGQGGFPKCPRCAALMSWIESA